MLWRPAWFGLKTIPLAYAAEPLLRPVLAVLWLMPVLGWFADDSGIIVPAAALPLALPLAIGLLAAAAYSCHPSLASSQPGTTVRSASRPVASGEALLDQQYGAARGGGTLQADRADQQPGQR
jgi:hypothetical protein